MGLSVPAATNPSVTTAILKAELSIPALNTDHDSEIARLEQRATAVLEKIAARNFTTRTCVLTLDKFPTVDFILLPRPPLSSITSIAYDDTNGDSQTWSSANYIAGTTSTPGRVTPAYGETWPSTRPHIEAVTITYVAGYGATETDVPTIAKQAVVLTVKAWFEQTHETGLVPESARSLIMSLHPGTYGEVYGVGS